MPAGPPEVYSLDEIARAAYVDRSAVEALVARGRLRPIPGTSFVAEADALAAARVLRHAALLATQPVAHDLFMPAALGPGAMPRPGAWSMAVHLTVVVVIFALGRTAAPVSATAGASPASHLVFLVEPGPGGGGGGGGARVPRPAARLIEPAKAHAIDAVSVPQVAPHAAAPEPEPIPVKPLAPVAAAIDRRQGEIDAPARTLASGGPGVDGAGTGRDGGNGRGRGAGGGDGEDRGFGGGPYRPGSGIEPPRLLREVKATYSEEARRANVVGDVLMEVVVRADGTVGSARVTRGLGFGLDERAAAAVRQWRFAPARRAGEPVDVAVEVAMEFNLR
ncbi:MAG TPA: energy transducer TonB [Vicinamibacterales bacterium]|jgi:protein TonB|nr:energy transducer TonB [Vicinamibacterales bacterium]